mgnify:CR=1 FL=1
MNNIKICENCALYRQNICILNNRSRHKEDSCPEFKKYLNVCDSCGKEHIQTFLYSWDNKNYIKLCGSCFQATSTCGLCVNGCTCAFEQDLSPIPKQITKNIRQGNMMIQTTVKNPERVDKFCVNCHCFNVKENTCNKEFGHCGNQKPIFMKETSVCETETQS